MYFSPKAIRIFSISIALIALLEIAVRILNYRLYFAPDGLFAWMYKSNPHPPLTLHGGDPFFTISLVLLQVALLLYALYQLIKQKKHPRVALFVSGVLFMSLCGLHSAATNGGDVLIYSLLIFASIVLPYSSLSYYVGVFQIAIIYLSSAYHKSLPIWIPKGEAIYYVLANTTFATWFGSLFTYLPPLSKLLTYGTILVLYTAWIGFLIAYKNNLFRKIGVGLLILFHLGLTLTMHIHFIGLVMLAFLSLFLVYSDHHVHTVQKSKPNKHALTLLVALHIVLGYFLIGQTLYNFSLLTNEKLQTYPLLRMINTHVSYSGYKTGYNFFSLDASRNEWFELYEPSTGKDLLRGRTLETGQFSRPLSYAETVVNPRLHRLLYLNTKHKQGLKTLARYYCKQYSLQDVTIELYSQNIHYPATAFSKTKKYGQLNRQVLYTNTCANIK